MSEAEEYDYEMNICICGEKLPDGKVTCGRPACLNELHGIDGVQDE